MKRSTDWYIKLLNNFVTEEDMESTYIDEEILVWENQTNNWDVVYYIVFQGHHHTCRVFPKVISG